jgi:hypothetical protein
MVREGKKMGALNWSILPFFKLYIRVMVYKTLKIKFEEKKNFFFNFVNNF